MLSRGNEVGVPKGRSSSCIVNISLGVASFLSLPKVCFFVLSLLCNVFLFLGASEKQNIPQHSCDICINAFIIRANDC